MGVVRHCLAAAAHGYGERRAERTLPLSSRQPVRRNEVRGEEREGGKGGEREEGGEGGVQAMCTQEKQVGDEWWSTGVPGLQEKLERKEETERVCHRLQVKGREDSAEEGKEERERKTRTRHKLMDASAADRHE